MSGSTSAPDPAPADGCSVNECEGISFRQGVLDTLQSVTTHRHEFGHVTFITAGGFLCERLDAPDPSAEPDDAPAVRSVVKWADERVNWVGIPAGVAHRFTALADGSMYTCIYPSDSPDVIEPAVHVDGWETEEN